tara:strand:- start:937 stop:1365 length:429 start_codon:yes stop_codon:yes gene_type:complete
MSAKRITEKALAVFVRVLAGVSAVVQLVTVAPALRALLPSSYQAYTKRSWVMAGMAMGAAYGACGDVLASVLSVVIGYHIFHTIESDPRSKAYGDVKDKTLNEVVPLLKGKTYYVVRGDEDVRIVVNDEGRVVLIEDVALVS